MSFDLKSRRLSKFESIRRTHDEILKSSDDENDKFDIDCENYDFEIGPPKILKYKRELEPVKIESVDHAPKRFFELDLKDLLVGGMICDFCQSIAHKWATINEAYCCNDFKEYVQGLIDCQNYTDTMRENLRFDYKTSKFVTKVHKTTLIFRRKLNQIRKLSKIYTNSPQKFSVIEAKKDAKPEINVTKELNEIGEKFQQLLSDRQPDTLSINSFDSQDTKVKNRINYILSNSKYVDRGWTILNTDYDSNLYTKNSLDLAKLPPDNSTTIDIWSSHFTSPIIKNYKNGKTFQIIHTDRTGNIYYPNGKLALLITNSGNYRFFTAFSSDEKPITLASFDSHGNAFCNYNNGKLRYQINTNGGINFDQSGNCVRKWLFPVDSTKTLTFHPIRFSINEFMNVQIHNKYKIVFQFRSRHGACKFLIRLNSKNFLDNTEYNPFKLTPNETICLKLKSRADNLLRLLHIHSQAQSFPSKSTGKLMRRSNFYNSSSNMNNTTHTSTSNNRTNPNATSSLKFPPLLSLAEQLSNKESYTYSISKSTFLDNASSISTTTRSSNRLIDKNTMNNSILFSLQDSVRS